MKRKISNLLTAVIAVAVIFSLVFIQTAVFADEIRNPVEPDLVSGPEYPGEKLQAGPADADPETVITEPEQTGPETVITKPEQAGPETVTTEPEPDQESFPVSGSGFFSEQTRNESAQALLSEKPVVEIEETADAMLKDPDTLYVIYGRDGQLKPAKSGNHLVVPENSSSEQNPITIILDNVRVSQETINPTKSWLTIEKGNHVVVMLRGDSYVKAWSHDEIGSNDGMSAIHVARGSSLKVTSEEGDGSVSGSLEAHGGGGQYGGAGIGTRYNEDSGSILIAGGTIKSYGGYSAAGIGSGRDGKATEIRITGGDIYAEGGKYAAGIGGGDNVSAGEGGDLVDLSITGGKVTAKGGDHGAGIGCSEGGSLEGTILIENATISATGGTEAAGIGGGDGASFWDNGKIQIRSGNITAAGGSEGAGIGGGQGTSYVKIEIDQTAGKTLEINATGGSGATGIGGGNGGGKYTSIYLRGGSIYAAGGYHSAAIGAGNDAGTIEIRGTGTIEAYGGADGCGIGAGNDGELTDHITIIGDTNGQYGERGDAPEGSRGLTITAVASYGRVEEGDGYEYENEAAAIGSGKATGGDIIIKNAVLNTKADNQGADIGGGGYHINPRGTVKNITIDNCRIQSSSVHKVAPGIGAGYGGTIDNITITNTWYEGCGIGGAPMDMNYTGLNDVKTITIENSHIRAVWDQEHPGKFVGGITPETGPLEHGAAGIGAGMYGAMKTISIKDSDVYASGFGSGSGIGSGGIGGVGWLVIDATKWDSGDTGTIEISGSDVEAYSGIAQFDPHTPFVIYDGTVFETVDNAEMFGGGAGIGGGSNANTGTINIHDCGNIKAVGSGAGIGSGEGTGKISKGAVDYIWLENIDYLYAKGGNSGAGIGSGGTESGLGYAIDAEAGALKQIYIKDCRNLYAYGGTGGAGIGTGNASPCYYHIDATEKGDWPISIYDSTIYAQGGEMGAGIGGGYETKVMNKGGESPRTLIKGKCRITAVGGEELLYEAENGVHGGGAGIGGGSCGALSYLEIDVDEDYGCAAKGTITDPGASKYYVRAYGNGGAAGIGSGGCSWQLRSPTYENSDSDSIVIKHGAVFARGGESPLCADPDHLEYGIFDMGDLVNLGAGAGIGGGSAGSIVRDLRITGGYVVAEAGTPTNENDVADDIGAGGNYSDNKWYQNSDRKNESLTISDGTVLCDTIGRFTESCKITGGSISAVVPDVKNLYRTRAKLIDTQEKVDSLKTEKSYGAGHIYSDPDGYVYLYLEEKGSETKHDQYADIEVNTSEHKNKWHYTGYTDTSHTGILKQEGDDIPFKDPGEIYTGDDFTLSLEDAGLDGAEWTFFAEGAASETASGRQTVSPGAAVSLHADTEGDYQVSGTTDFTKDPEMFWGSRASFAGTVSEPVPEGPFYLRTYQDLEDMARNIKERPEVYADAEYIVLNNIHAPSDSSWTLGIGSVADGIPFNGSLEGNGYCISGLHINLPAYGGLFEWIGENGTVQNLYLFDCDYSAASEIGGGLTAVNDGTISYCINGVNLSTGVYVQPETGELIPLKDFNSVVSGIEIGGIAGRNNGMIFACRSAAEMNGTGTIAGGIAGRNLGTIDNCAANNHVSSKDHEGAEECLLGGLCGENSGTITGGYSSADIYGPESALRGNITGTAEGGTLKDIFYTTSEEQQYRGGGAAASEENINGMPRGKMMTDSFKEQLSLVGSNKVSWIRTDSSNAGLPRIKNPSAAFADGDTHTGAKLSIAPIPAASEAGRLLSEGMSPADLSGAVFYSSMLTDAEGYYIPAELWTQSEMVYSVPVKGRALSICALSEDGSVRKIDSITTRKTQAGYEASFESSGVTAFMIVTENTAVKSPKTGDKNSVFLYLCLSLTALAGGTAAICRRKKKD